MKKPFFTASLLLTVCLLQGCGTDDGRVRQGIHDPIQRHQQRGFRMWPFHDNHEPKAPKPPPPVSEPSYPEYQPLEPA